MTAVFEVAGERVSVLDDVALVDAFPTSMSEFLSAAEETARPLGLSFNSHNLHLGRREEPIPTAFQMARQQLPDMEQGDSHFQFGVLTGVRIDETP